MRTPENRRESWRYLTRGVGTRCPSAPFWALRLVSLLLLAAIASSQTATQQVITTVAGTDFIYPNQALPGVEAPLGAISGLAFDPAGNLYVSDPSNDVVLKMDKQGIVTVFAGNGAVGFSGDGGAATSAALNLGIRQLDLQLVRFSGGMAADSSGNLFIADTGNHRVRKISQSGVVTTIAGNGQQAFSGDGSAAPLASLNNPISVVLDFAGNVFITDAGNFRVRKVSPEGIITTVAGNGVDSYSRSGPATQSPLLEPGGITVDTAGNLYVGTSTISSSGVSTASLAKVSPSGVMSLIQLSTRNHCSSFQIASSLAFDASGNLFISDNDCAGVYKMTAAQLSGNSQLAVTVAGTGAYPYWGFSGDGGPATAALLNGPRGLAVDSEGNLFLADSGNLRVRRVIPSGIIGTVAGSSAGYRYGGDGARALSANLSSPQGVAADSVKGLLIADTMNNRIRNVAPEGIISTIAGTGDYNFSGDGGSARAAALEQPHKVAAGFAGDVLIADTNNYRTRRVDSVGIINTLLGGGVGVAAGTNGDVFANDPLRVYKVTSNGAATTVASGFAFAYDIASDAAGNLLVADLGNPSGSGGGSVHRVTTDGADRVIAGNGKAGFSGDGGSALAASLNYPSGVASDAVGNVYIADSLNHRVRKVTPDGVISTVAGTGTAAFSGDGGPVTAAALNNPMGVAVDASGNMYIADTGNNRIRAVLASPPAVRVLPLSLTFTGLNTGAPTSTQSFSITSVPGLAFSAVVSTTSGENWLSVTPQSGAAPRLIDVTADPSRLSSPGTYTGTIAIFTPNGNPTTATVTVTFVVSAAQSPTLAPLDPRNFSFAFAKSTPAQSQKLIISNAGGGTLSFTAATTIATPAGAKWLRLSQASGQATPGSPAILTVTADPTGLGPGTFTGAIGVTAGATTLSVPVTITVSVLDQAILLSQRGLFFTAVAQGGVVPPQTFAVLNIGIGVVAWTAKPVPPSPINGVVSTVPWLSVSPSSGATDASLSPPTVTVTVDQSKLGQGTYYGLVEVDAPTAANRSQVLTVVLQVLKAGSNVGAALTPGSLLFSTSVGASSPSSQNVLAYNITANAKSFRSVVSADPGLSLVTLPTDATLDPQNPTPIVVPPFTNALGPGIYSGIVTLQFDDGRVIRLTVKVIVTKPGGASSASIPRTGSRAEDTTNAACTPTKLQPILTAPNDAFEGFTGFGLKLGVFVKDDCGVPLQSGSVEVRFNNGDTKSTLQPLQGGLWEGTWYTHNPSTSVNLKVHAENTGISGDLQTNGSLASQTPPTFDASGIISGFGGAASAPLAPGEVISIYGSGLAETSLAASGFPLKTTLVDTLVTIQGTPLPLYYVGDQQVNAVVPYSLNNTSLNAPLQILVQRGNTLSQPVYVTVATAEPTIYSGANAVTSYPASGGSPYIVTPANPAHAGDTIVIYCLGLGAVDPPVADGGLPTGTSKAAPVQMLIGNQVADVKFQGLQGQFPGLYQVNAVIPAGVPKGSSVPVTISLGGQTSLPIPIPIQ